MLEVKNVIKKYHNGGEDIFALNNVSLTLNQGDYLSIIGPSGAGKSTLLHILGGLDRPTQGQVFFKQQSIQAMSDQILAVWRNQVVGFVFQFYHLIEELNVLENVTLPQMVIKRKSSFKKAKELLEYLEIIRFAGFYPSQLSGGQRQKVALARALVNDPQIILCDEPTGNLDLDSQTRVINFLEELNKKENKTIVLVTHNSNLAQRAKRIIKIEAGCIA